MLTEQLISKILLLVSLANTIIQPDGFQFLNKHYELSYHFNGTYRLDIDRNNHYGKNLRKLDHSIEEFCEILPMEITNVILQAGSMELNVGGSTTIVPIEFPLPHYQIHDFGEHQIHGISSFKGHHPYFYPTILGIIHKQYIRILELEEKIASLQSEANCIVV